MTEERKSSIPRRRILAGAALGGAVVAAGAHRLTGPGGDAIDGKSRALPVKTLQRPPDRADVVIIGGGNIGAATAFELARRGVSVVLCEKGAIAGEASGRSVGQVTSGGLDLVKMDILRRSKELWRGYSQTLQAETGYRMTGHLEIFKDRHVQAYWENWIRDAKELMPTAKLIGSSELGRHVALDGNDWLGAYMDPTDGCAEPQLVAPALANAAARLGAKIVAPCAVRGIETEGGRVAHVITEAGSIRTTSVVLAGGCWSTLFAESIGLRLPSFSAFSMCRTVSTVNGPKCSAALPDMTWRPQIDGNHVVSVVGGVFPLSHRLMKYAWDYRDALAKVEWDIHPNLSRYFLDQLATPSRWRLDERSPFEKLRILEPTTNAPLDEQAVASAKRHVPAFRNMNLGELWGGALVATPDNLPTMSAVPSLPGLFLATGFTYGLTMAPAAGEAMAQLIAGEKPSIDLRPYRYERYIDGSPMQFVA